MTFEQQKIKEEVSKTAKHIGIMSEGCLMTLCEEVAHQARLNALEEQKQDIQSVLNMLEGSTDRKQIANYVKELIKTPTGVKCEVSGRYGKDNDKNLHFYCEFCGEEMDYEEDRICPARNKILKSLLKSRQEIKGGKGKVLRSLKDLKPQTAWALVDGGGFVLSAILNVYSFVIFLKKKTAERLWN